MNALVREYAGWSQCVVFALGSSRYALPLLSIERILRAAEYTPAALGARRLG